MCFDHYPFHDAMLIVPGASTPPPPASRFVKRGAYMLCLTCGFTSAYCRCASTPAPAQGAQDGAETSLAKRARECMGGT